MGRVFYSFALFLFCFFLLISCEKSIEGVYISSKDSSDTLIIYENNKGTDFSYNKYIRKKGKKVSSEEWQYSDNDIYIYKFINYGDMVGYVNDTLTGIFPCHYSFFTGKCYEIIINQDDGHSFRRIKDYPTSANKQ